jgi:hypothetical protein
MRAVTVVPGEEVVATGTGQRDRNLLSRHTSEGQGGDCRRVPERNVVGEADLVDGFAEGGGQMFDCVGHPVMSR